MTGRAADFPSVTDAMSVSRTQLARLDENVPDAVTVESLFVASIVLLIVSLYEVHLAEKFAERARRSGDRHLANFVARQLERRFRSPDIGNISQALGDFGGDYRDRFMDRIRDTPAHASWDNLIRARHTIVHGGKPTTMTLRDLEKAYRFTREVLVALYASLELSETTEV